MGRANKKIVFDTRLFSTDFCYEFVQDRGEVIVVSILKLYVACIAVVVVVCKDEIPFIVEISFIDGLNIFIRDFIFTVYRQSIFVGDKTSAFYSEETACCQNRASKEKGRAFLVENKCLVWFTIDSVVFFEFFVKITIVGKPCSCSEEYGDNDIFILFLKFADWSYNFGHA